MFPFIVGLVGRGMAGAAARGMGSGFIRAAIRHEFKDLLFDRDSSPLQNFRMRLEVRGLNETVQFFNDLPKYLRSEIAKEINNLAHDARDDFLAGLPNRMTLRTGWYKPGNAMGFNVRRATTSSLTAEIYSRAPWLELQETGGRKSPRGNHLAVPTTNVRRTKRDIIGKSQRPKALGKKLFDVTTRKGQQFLAMRVGRGRRAELKFMYTLAKGGNISPRLHFYSNLSKYVNQRGEYYMSRAISRAKAMANRGL